MMKGREGTTEAERHRDAQRDFATKTRRHEEAPRREPQNIRTRNIEFRSEEREYPKNA
jgi:hypothetical protein